MKYRIITIISFIGSTVISLLGGWDKSLQTLIIFMTIDWLTGGILLPVVFQKSPKSQNGALESHAGWKGLCRKAMMQILPERYAYSEISGTSILI